MSKEIIKIKYHEGATKLKKISVGDWIDLASAEDVEMKAGEFRLISFGVSMQLPDGYEANIVPRSSTFKNFKLEQMNYYGVIDNSYSGDNDIWKLPVRAAEDTVIHKGDRIAQFRINKKQPEIEFVEVETLGNADRGGFGSTGIK